jgi:hypothetical protein
MTISEVGKKYELTPDTSGIMNGRSYTRGNKDPGRETRLPRGGLPLDRVYQVHAGAGLPVETLIEYVRLFQLGDETLMQRKALLERERDELSAKIGEMNKTLERLNGKIERYESMTTPIENELKRTD